MPSVIEPIGDELVMHPKYDSVYVGRSKYEVNYGREGFYLVAADVTNLMHTSLSANADVDSFPLDITQQIGPIAFASVDARADAKNIPLAGITENSTYRQLLRRIFILCQFAQSAENARFVRFPNPGKQQIFSPGITLGTTWDNLTAEDQDVLRDIFSRFKLDRRTLGTTMTLRQILKAYGDQWRGTSIVMLGIEL